MNTTEINSCLQYYAAILNDDGGDIYVNDGKGTKYTVGKYSTYKNVKVDNCALVLETGTAGDSIKTIVRHFIPFHSIVKIETIRTVRC